MPMYEGLGVGDEPKVMIFDIGTAYTKCGLAGETGPRCIIPSKTKNTRTLQMVNVWEYDCAEELYENLKGLIHTLIFRHLLLTPKDRRVVVIESLLCPSIFRETVAKVLFKHFEVGSVMFASSHLVSALTLGANICMVLDLGYQDTMVVPVYQGIPIMKGWQVVPLASKAIHSRIKSQLLEHGTISTPGEKDQAVSSVPDCITEAVLEDIKVRCCFVTSYTRGQQIQEVTVRGGHANKLPPPPPDTEYPIDGKSILHVSGRIREHSCEVMFEQDGDETSIATIVLESLIRCPIDTRKALAANVLVTGGSAMLPGFYHRLQQELEHLLHKPLYSNQLGVKTFAFHQAPVKENCTAWLGGALLGALETLPARSLSRDAFVQKGKLPDWCCVDSEFLEDTRLIK